MERNKTKEQETNFLISESKKNPELFERETFIDSPDFLKKIGIFFGEPEGHSRAFPIGYLKLWPQDFIVEEKSKYGVQETVDPSDSNIRKGFSDKDPVVYATLVKCEISTIDAIQDLARVLKIDPENIQFAGLKDDKAITSQLINIRGVDANKLKEVSSPCYFLKNIHSGKDAFKVGHLIGNKFTVLIRTGSDFDKEQFNQNLEKVKKHGFLNFYYSQRFGEPRFINWFWGLLVLKGDYRNAVLSCLCSDGGREISYFKNIRAEIKKNIGNWEKIADIINPYPIYLQNEIKLVKHLQKNPRDFIGALKQIPEIVRIWVFAYGSLLFNRKISEYTGTDEAMPEKLPLMLSGDKNDWLPYFDFLREDQIFSMPIKNLIPFPDILLRKRKVKTKEKADIHKVEFVPEGVILSFSLPKGCYATSLLANLFQLATGLPPKDISKDIIDTKKFLGEVSIKNVAEKFKKVIVPQSGSFLDKPE